VGIQEQPVLQPLGGQLTGTVGAIRSCPRGSTLDPHSFCTQCGASLGGAARFCESCGAPTSGDAEVAAGPGSGAGRCPKCRSSSDTFTAAEYATKEFSEAEIKAADAADKWGPESSQIYLEEPEEPESPSLGFWLIAPWIPALNFVLFFCAPLKRGAKYFMAGLVAVFFVCVFTPRLYEVGAYALVGCFLILFYYVALFIDRGRRKDEYVTKLLPEYQRTLPRWQRLRFCRACEVSWLDGDPAKYVEVDRTEQLLKG
jgi:hypothetical protein